MPDHNNSGRRNYNKNYPGNRQRFKGINRNQNLEHNRQQRRNRLNPNHHTSQSQRITPPYNFVPLNERPIEAPLFPGKNTSEIGNGKAKMFTLSKYYCKLLTGYIDLEIKTLTPVYIRDTLTSKDIEDKFKIENQKGRYINADFFIPAGKIRIPGSSLRGMIRTLVEIVNFGKFVNFDGNIKFFYRALGDRSLNLRNKYQHILTKSVDGAFGMKCNAGYLCKINDNYYIKPAEKININGYQIDIFRIEEDLISKPSLKQFDNDETYKFNKDIFFSYKNKLIHQHQNPRINLFYAKAEIISTSESTDTPNKGCLVCTGLIPGKKHMQHIILPPQENVNLEIDSSFIEEYKNDKYRNAVNLLNLIEQSNENSDALLPCFYITDNNNKVIAFGHTPYFRLAYNHFIKDLVPDSLKQENIIDIAEAIFGNASSFASRVFFEDAFPIGDINNLGQTIPRILGSPKATCFQNYLEQNNYAPVTNRSGTITAYNNLKDYNDNDALIRGYKLYWHRSGNQSDYFWSEEKIEIEKNKISNDDINYLNNLNNTYNKNNNSQNKLFEIINHTNRSRYKFNLNNIYKLEHRAIRNCLLKLINKYTSQYTIINPISADSTFKGRIRFENLSPIELGALLFVLDLPENCAHKLGMGKPLGLGSIKIKPQLFISTRKTRYSNIESEFISSDKGNEDIGKSDLGEYKKEFAKFMLEQLNFNVSTTDDKVNQLWKYPRMIELKTLLSTNHDISFQYPSLGDYRRRDPLPKASELQNK